MRKGAIVTTDLNGITAVGVVKEYGETNLQAVFPISEKGKTILQEKTLERGAAHRIYPDACNQILLRQLIGIPLEQKPEDEKLAEEQAAESN